MRTLFYWRSVRYLFPLSRCRHPSTGKQFHQLTAILFVCRMPRQNLGKLGQLMIVAPRRKTRHEHLVSLFRSRISKLEGSAVAL
jgi:hypothetical protein